MQYGNPIAYTQYNAYDAWVEYITSWRDSNGWRYRFNFASRNDTPTVQDHILDSRYGIDFYHQSNSKGSMSAKWQCEDDDNEVWTFDI